MSFLFNLNTKIHTETETKPVIIKIYFERKGRLI